MAAAMAARGGPPFPSFLMPGVPKIEPPRPSLCFPPLPGRRRAPKHRIPWGAPPPCPPLFHGRNTGERRKKRADLPLGPSLPFYSIKSPPLSLSIFFLLKETPSIFNYSQSTLPPFKIITNRSLHISGVAQTFSKNYNQALAISKIITKRPLNPGLTPKPLFHQSFHAPKILQIFRNFITPFLIYFQPCH